MKANISSVENLPGTLVIFEGADGCGKSTQILKLRKKLRKQGYTVTISSWKDAPFIGPFLQANEAAKKMELMVTSEANLILQVADLAYRIEREIIPALSRGEVVLLERGLETIVVRGMMLGMSEEKIRNGLLWFTKSVYKELFEKAITIYMNVPLKETLERIYERADMVRRGSEKTHCSILTLHLINNLVYSDTGDKLTHKDKRKMLHIAQKNIVENYERIYKDAQEHLITIKAEGKKKSIADDISSSIVETLEKKAVLLSTQSETLEWEEKAMTVDKHVAELKKADAKHKLVKAYA